MCGFTPGELPPPPPQAYLDENLAPQMLAVDGTLFALAMLCVLLRVYVRVGMLKTFGIDGKYRTPDLHLWVLLTCYTQTGL